MATVRSIIQHLRESGLGGAVTHYWVRGLDTIHERRLGIKTWEFISLETEGIDNSDFQRYSATSYTEFRQLMKHVSICNGEEVFVDYGSGLGRVLVMAATYPFKRVMGLEVVERFNMAAAANFDKCKAKLKCTELDLVTGDASAFVPPPDATVFYFNNPFKPHLVTQAIANIHSSLTKSPRRIQVIFRHPKALVSTLASVPWLRGRKSYRIVEHEYWIYDIDASEARLPDLNGRDDQQERAICQTASPAGVERR